MTHPTATPETAGRTREFTRQRFTAHPDAELVDVTASQVHNRVTTAIGYSADRYASSSRLTV